jgi:hypothetical protein
MTPEQNGKEANKERAAKGKKQRAEELNLSRKYVQCHDV